ncbi:cellulase family glycosylhydrolase [Flammeovirga sp. SubArs3]|uniref:cellulase family glycosylhydrolase n=1 Tax=Flammeovirga sp. SubArs3 TaxID=2995316 RepID=UPI00248C9652|nr:cellulase family glycosylhydrolase [Flammeovirga sp. SubArs3]
MKRIIILLSLLTYCQLAWSQGFLRTERTNIINDEGNVLLRSIGTGNWMIQEGYMMQSTGANINTHTQFREKLEEQIGKRKTAKFYDAWLENHFTKADLDSMKAWGFNSVRVALHYKWFTLPIEEEKEVKGTLTNTWLDKGFAMTDQLLEWCEANEMYLILDMHGAPGGQGKDANISDYDTDKPSLWESEENQDKLTALWIKLADRYKDNIWIGGYDLINEPNWGFNGSGSANGCGCSENDQIWDLHERLIQAIRTVDQNHIVYVSGNCWGNTYAGFENHSLKDVDDNMVITFHKYWNYNSDVSVQGWLEMREKFQLPLWMSEAGENSNTWFSDCIALFELNNIGWSWWPVKKSRVNNILKVETPQSYKDLLAAWEKGEDLSKKETYNAVMEYMESHKNENCIVASDVIYAMMGQSTTNLTSPYTSHKINTPILFADYDMGRNRYAYFDHVSADYHVDTHKERAVWNSGYSYRNDGVDIGIENDAPYVGWTEDGEWLKYTIQITSSGVYSIEVNYSAEEHDGALELTKNHIVLGEAILPKNGKPFDWRTVEMKNISLSEGNNELVFKIKKGGIHLKDFVIKKAKEL